MAEVGLDRDWPATKNAVPPRNKGNLDPLTRFPRPSVDAQRFVAPHCNCWDTYSWWTGLHRVRFTQENIIHGFQGSVISC